ncbi:MAG: HAMP domain-containing protein [Ignavibacteriales bacterium]|nr:HAMP domain-containing protein [Ignavibacteriales bacterium]
MNFRFFKSLYWKISALFLLLLVLIGAVYSYITLFTAEMYVQEATQRVSIPLAKSISEKVAMNVEMKTSPEMMRKVFSDIISFNPTIEIYILDTNGIITYSSLPEGHRMKQQVSLAPIHTFIKDEGNTFILGEDPCYLLDEKVFSASPILSKDKNIGYTYVILHGTEYVSSENMLFDSYIILLGQRTLLVTLVSAGIVGLVILGFIMKKLRKTKEAVQHFESGIFSSRVEVKSNDEIDQLGIAFNSMANTIEANVEEIKKTDSLRRELVANISHDLKTPIASIQGYAETLLMKEENLSSNERKKYLETILSGTNRLITLVEQILELSKLEAKQIFPKPEPFSVAELVHDIVQKFQPQAERKQIRFRTIIPDELPFAFADIGMMDRALSNLIDNALQYTPEIGVITIEIQRNNGNLFVNISDTGVGIAQEDLPHIFDRFYRTEKSRNRNSGGTGLGLAIAQKIIEAHGFAISVQSKVNDGTTFSFPLSIVTS